MGTSSNSAKTSLGSFPSNSSLNKVSISVGGGEGDRGRGERKCENWRRNCEEEGKERKRR